MITRRITSFSVLAFGLLVSATYVAAQGGSLRVTSDTFLDGESIPEDNSAYGLSATPHIRWAGAPAGTRSFALILRDPDAPTPEPFVHWVIYNIPAGATELPAGLPTDARLTMPASIAGTTQGNMGMGRAGYFGPRPPTGSPHRYIFTVYALDLDPTLAGGMNAASLEQAMAGHVVAQGQITGVFQWME